MSFIRNKSNTKQINLCGKSPNDSSELQTLKQIDFSLLLRQKNCSIPLFIHASIFATDSILCASSAYTSVPITYCMGSDFSLQPVDQQQRQLAVRHDSIVVPFLRTGVSVLASRIELVMKSENVNQSLHFLYFNPAHIFLLEPVIVNLGIRFLFFLNFTNEVFVLAYIENLSLRLF